MVTDLSGNLNQNNNYFGKKKLTSAIHFAILNYRQQGDIDMEDISTLIVDFQNYANSLRSGYLKLWKATGIIETLCDGRIPIINDEVRLLSYLKNCLEMEGFYSTDIELIMGWLYEKIA